MQTEKRNATGEIMYSSYLPWLKPTEEKKFYYDTQDITKRLNAFHNEIVSFVSWIVPTHEEQLMREDALSRVKKLVALLWADAKVKVYGSFETNLCIPTSDIDLVIFGASHDQGLLGAMYQLAEKLLETETSDCYPNVISTTKVPVIKFRDARSGCLVDITFDCGTCVDTTKLIKEYLDQYVLLRPLTITLKYFLKQTVLNDTWTGGIGSYTLILMIVSFFQLHTTGKGVLSETENLGSLLLGFFELYGKKFNYNTDAISLLDGGSYFPKEKKGWFQDSNPELLSIEHPTLPDIDVGQASFNIAEAKLVFLEAFQTLEDLSPVGTSLLIKIISIPSTILQHRNYIRVLYGTPRLNGGRPKKNKTKKKSYSKQRSGSNRNLSKKARRFNDAWSDEFVLENNEDNFPSLSTSFKRSAPVRANTIHPSIDQQATDSPKAVS